MCRCANVPMCPDSYRDAMRECVNACPDPSKWENGCEWNERASKCPDNQIRAILAL
jgi:hypothetical protein